VENENGGMEGKGADDILEMDGSQDTSTGGITVVLRLVKEMYYL